ncbi:MULTISPECIES: cupredoxin domain-containing protein [Agrobacterium]|uniref:Plastocyanin/azurin family copper-binding protein n=1 Tax=Agrobacterium tumefaciens TaxID=358 RepID=A0AAF0KAV2_AGRTU|nr:MULTISPECIES: plastocyanin/azurin family copper-binding protein [Agrobacterium]TZG34890.1 copper oxidase [Agrobacterium sp. B1(2019)]WGM61449.1 plastocyanin/azurin family copper-binding protein [Agrobacterium tumefaciens]CVI63674.1 Copper tolerance protein [Agrobacterium salinitolerans str. Hayward 0363]
MTKLKIALLFAVLATPALASGTHGDGHEAMAIGEPGDKAKVTQTIQVTMKETPDGKMIFTPGKFEFKKGKTVRFAVKNVGELDHEFILDEHEANLKHKAAMEKAPEMEHDNPNAISLAPGESGEIIWKFTNDGMFEFACLKPGHYEAGMRGDLKVSAK